MSANHALTLNRRSRAVARRGLAVSVALCNCFAISANAANPEIFRVNLESDAIQVSWGWPPNISQGADFWNLRIYKEGTFVGQSKYDATADGMRGGEVSVGNIDTGAYYSFEVEACFSGGPFQSSNCGGWSNMAYWSPAPGWCLSGYVWRQVRPDDHVCVTPQTRTQVQEDNAAAAERRNPDGTCHVPYVWREAFVGDDVCVAVSTRTQTQQDNSEAVQRVVPPSP